MEPAIRWLAKCRKVGNSVILTLPHRMLHTWPAKAGDLLVIYQTMDALVVVPLEKLHREGSPQVLSEVERLTRRLPH